MTHYQDIYEVAADNYGIITSVQAKELGISDKEMSAIAARGRIYRIGHGVYRLTDYIPVPNDAYAEAVALVGPDAFLYGESVIAMHGLAPTNPARICVATPKRVRKHLPAYLRLIRVPEDTQAASYEGIASQSVFDAILSCKGKMMDDRLVAAATEARRQGFISKAEYDSLMEVLS